MFRTAQKYRIQSKIRTMKNNISAPPNEINNVEEKSSHGEKISIGWSVGETTERYMDLCK